MTILDSAQEINKIDKGNILGSIVKLPYQVDQAWHEVNSLDIPEDYSRAKAIVLSGMGGSALGGRIADCLTPDKTVPMEVFTEFNLPKYVDKNTLVIASSYSGNTAETLSATKEAIEKEAKIIGICTGGKLENILKEHKLPVYVIRPWANPSGQPRMGLGYSISSILTILSRLKFIRMVEEEMLSVVRIMGEAVSDFGADIPSGRNLAKSLALKLKGKIPVLVASEHLVGSGHAFKNQLNENSKTFSALFDIPELNHHLMEGLRNPALAKEYLHFVFIESELYSRKILARYNLTKEVVEKNDISTDIYKLRTETKLQQIFELLVLGSYISLYLAILYGIDPAPIPWVDYFKSKLK